MDPRSGLSATEAARRLATAGPNELVRSRPTARWRIWVRQLASPLIWLLLGAAVISAILGEVIDAIAIGAIVVINAIVGYSQEHRAEHAVLALRDLTAPHARVRRDGAIHDIAAREVVDGDLLVLEAGDIVAADARVIDASRLHANEMTLTGESLPIAKQVEPVAAGKPLADRVDHVFAGTSIAAGTGTAEVIATGMRTELGKIAGLITSAEAGVTPLQIRLARVSRVLMYACLGIVTVVAAVGIFRHAAAFDVFMSAISLAVAAVPEGMPAIVTIALAIGVQRMAARHVLVRKLPAVETLGCATVICTDKTGTLTAGDMRVRELWGADHDALVDAAAACCDAELGPDGKPGSGDTTELAILLEGAGRGITRGAIERDRPRAESIPFDAATKQMAIRRYVEGGMRWYVKGAFEAVSAQCVAGLTGAAAATTQLSARGLRVIAVASGSARSELALLGLIGLADPPRPEAIDAIATARSAGIRTIMITGDHQLTARAIATEMGIADVHARATPEDKLQIVRELKEQGEIVAMTGDGVNDAPALREAHVGIAMGVTGTEVTREASDIVLADDNYASIVAGVREGRGIFDNIRKAIVYLLAGNASELLVMLVAGLAGFPIPLLPVHLLWINLITDGFPALALVMDPTDADAMRHGPRDPAESLLARREWAWICVSAVVESAVTLGVFAWALVARDLAQARSLAFMILVFSELFRAFAARSPTKVFWQVGAFGNLVLVGVVVASAALQIAICHVTWTRTVFQLAPLPAGHTVIAIALGLIPVTVLELAKLAGRRAPTARSARFRPSAG